jgi:mRNA interferase MazF
MVSPAAGSVVLVKFPFSDLSSSKLRPAIILSSSGFGDWILCQVTSNAYSDQTAMEISDSDFISGSLHRVSFCRPGKLFTANTSIMTSEVGRLKPEVIASIREAVINIIKGT